MKEQSENEDFWRPEATLGNNVLVSYLTELIHEWINQSISSRDVLMAEPVQHKTEEPRKGLLT